MVKKIDAIQYEKVSASETCLVVFGSAWCGDCVRIEPFLKELDEEYAQTIKIYKVDSKEEADLSAKLNIRAIPTLIFYREGIEVGERLIEPKSKQIIQDAIHKNLLHS